MKQLCKNNLGRGAKIVPKSNNRAGFSSKLCDIICDSRPFFCLEYSI